jgi:cyclohexanone monooxygenase
MDLERLRAKYREERDRRVREDGIEQYVLADGAFAEHYNGDPYAPEIVERAPLLDVVQVLVVGGGFGGMLAAAALIEEGVTDLRIVEHASDFGGTWYWNRYPGAQCDLESYVYLPLLEETDYVPRERYAYAPEIFEHVQRIADRYRLREHALFQTNVERITWEDAVAAWVVETNRGDRFHARYVINATGYLVRPKLPGIPGLETFAGKMFHTARWDYGYTGGDHSGGLIGLEGKRVAIIGTGATAIQIVPIVARHAEHLYVFQRTPSSIDERGNAPTDLEWAASLTPGWQQRRQDTFDQLMSGELLDHSQVTDGWTSVRRRTIDLLAAAAPGADIARFNEIADAEHMEYLRDRVDRLVDNLSARELLKPWYRYLCKRAGFSDDYLPTFNRSNVTLVDTSPSRGVQRILPHAVVAEGVEYPVDCLILATGFEVNSAAERRIGMTVVGRGGRTLGDHWRRGWRTLHGYATHGFPNWFFVGPSQAPASFNFSGVVTKQARLIAYLIRSVRDRGGVAVEPTAEAEEAWVREVCRLAAADRTLENCTPGYRNREGSRTDDIPSGYNGSTRDFDLMIEEWVQSGELPGMRIHGEGEHLGAASDQG